MKITTIIFLFIGCFHLSSEVFPEDRQYEWHKAGFNHSIEFTDTINVIDCGFSTHPDSSNSQLLETLLNSIDEIPTVIYFPIGEYHFTKTINLKSNIKIHGENSYSTILVFDNGGNGNLINVHGSIEKFVDTLSFSVEKNIDILIVKNHSFSNDDLLYLYDNDIDKITSSWAEESTGQILKIEKVGNDTLFLMSKIRRDYKLEDIPRIQKINSVTNVFIENFTLIRIDETQNQTSNIEFSYADNCKVSCIISRMCNFAHIESNKSLHIEITGSYFREGFNYGGGGKAYGVMLQYASSECLVYNNIFERLRHSMILQAGANGNVFSYNYSFEPYWTDVSLPENSAGDMVLHGNYPYANLFEGNICQNIVIDNSHGINGPHNLFFRNRAELYGIFMNTNPASDEQSFIGNEITNSEILKGLYFLNGNNHFEHGNNIRGDITPDGTDELKAYSYYLMGIPFWYETHQSFPPIGVPNKIIEYNNEALERLYNGDYVACNFDDTDVESIANDDIHIYPNPAQDYLYISLNGELSEIQLYSIAGNKIATLSANTANYVAYLNNGLYLVKIKSNGLVTNKLFIKN